MGNYISIGATDPFDDPEVITSVKLADIQRKLDAPNTAPIPQPQTSAQPSTAKVLGLGLGGIALTAIAVTAFAFFLGKTLRS